MACENLCNQSSPNYNPFLCGLCQTLKYLLTREPKPFPYPEPGPLAEQKLPLLELERVKDQIFAELVHEAIRKRDLHPSSVLLTTMRDSGIYEEVVKSELQECEDTAKAMRLKIESLAGK